MCSSHFSVFFFCFVSRSASWNDRYLISSDTSGLQYWQTSSTSSRWFSASLGRYSSGHDMWPGWVEKPEKCLNMYDLINMKKNMLLIPAFLKYMSCFLSLIKGRDTMSCDKSQITFLKHKNSSFTHDWQLCSSSSVTFWLIFWKQQLPLNSKNVSLKTPGQVNSQAKIYSINNIGTGHCPKCDSDQVTVKMKQDSH